MRGRMLDLFLLLVCAGVLALGPAFTVGPEGGLRLLGVSVPATCLLRRTTGLPCPFCGLSRSVVAFWHDGFVASLRWHPVGPFVVLGAAAFCVSAVWTAARGTTPVIERRTSLVACLMLIAASVAVWVIRLAMTLLP